MLPKRDARFSGLYDTSTPADIAYLDEKRELLTVYVPVATGAAPGDVATVADAAESFACSHGPGCARSIDRRTLAVYAETDRDPGCRRVGHGSGNDHSAEFEAAGRGIVIKPKVELSAKEEKEYSLQNYI